MSDPWRPGASVAALRARADMLAAMRLFFAQRDVLEVETPLLSAAASTDLHLHSLAVEGGRFLHTSPELAMKRLLAAGSGPIFQVCKVFRGGEAGKRHNPEFTMLEWYRPGFSLPQLMDEVADLVGDLVGSESPLATPTPVISYRELFQRHLGLDPHTAGDEEIARLGAQHAGGELPGMERSNWLELLMSVVVEPRLPAGSVFVTDFPACQAALSAVEPDDLGEPVARRFELYIDGMELANGYVELRDPAELERRQQQDLARRRLRGLPEVPPDQRLLAAMAAGLPETCGVALGLDRLLMRKLGADDIRAVLAFPWDIA